VSGRGLPVLAPGDEIRLGGQAYRVVALDGTSVRLADVAGAAMVMLIGHLLADPGFELVTSHRRVPLAAGGLEHLPAEVRASALWWEQHLAEVLTGVPAGAVPGTVPRPEYDPRLRSLRQRELAKHAALTAAGHEVALSTLQRLRRRYELEGVWGLVDRRYAAAGRGRGPGGRVDPRVVEAARRAISEQTDRSTGTVGRLRRRVGQLLAEDPDPPPMPPERTFYRLVARLSAGRHTFGSARTRRSLARQPEGPFGAVTAARPGEWTEIDSTPLDVRAVLDDGLVDRVELTGLVDQATRTLAAAVLRPTTKAVDASLLLARALTPEPMRPGWPDALRLTRSVLPVQSLTSIDARLEHAAARPVIVPETIVCDHGKAYLSAAFRSACRSLGISLAPAHPDTPTDKPVIERTLGSVSTLFAQYVAGYVGRSTEHRGKDAGQAAVWSMAELQALLDEWVVAVWQNRPHEGLRDPLSPDKALTPNEKYAALVAVAGYVPVPLGPRDYIELLPATWRVINSYGIKIARRTYDSAALNPYRRQSSGVAARRGLWEIRYDPTTSPGSGCATTTTRDSWKRPGRTCAPPRPRSASSPGPMPARSSPAAAATRSPRPRSPPPRRTCSTAPATGRPGRRRSSSTTPPPAAPVHRARGGSPGAPQPPPPRSGPAPPARPTVTRTPPARPVTGTGSRPRPRPRPRRRR
jgi:hypothetical protein